MDMHIDYYRENGQKVRTVTLRNVSGDSEARIIDDILTPKAEENYIFSTQGTQQQPQAAEPEGATAPDPAAAFAAIKAQIEAMSPKHKADLAKVLATEFGRYWNDSRAEDLENQAKAYEAQKEEIERQQAERKARSRRLPLVSSSPPSSFSLGEILKGTKWAETPPAAEEEPETSEPDPETDPDDFYAWLELHYPGASREEINGVRTYRTAYECTSCKHKGRRYAPANRDFVRCHKCEHELKLQPATDRTFTDGLPEPDEGGNFFIARIPFQGLRV